MDILRFTTAGSIDDGKSTLIGRLLYDTGNIKQDLLATISNEEDQLNLAHITDGLRAERDQGITIDVAYKYFSTAKRKYIVTDAPGHFQFTRNLVTGASNVDLMIVLVDAANGITSQTKKHAEVASFLRIPHIIVAINKMDCVAYDQNIFENIKHNFPTINQGCSIKFIPISALNGDNICNTSVHMPWYSGESLLDNIENIDPQKRSSSLPVRFTIQYKIPDGYYLGKVCQGEMHIGDKMTVYPKGNEVQVKKILREYDTVTFAAGGQNICLQIEADKHDIDRGSILVDSDEVYRSGTHIEAEVCWMDEHTELVVGAKYCIRVGTAEATAAIGVVTRNDGMGSTLSVNEFGSVSFMLDKGLPCDIFSVSPQLGRGILIEDNSNETVGAFIIVDKK